MKFQENTTGGSRAVTYGRTVVTEKKIVAFSSSFAKALENHNKHF